MTDSPTTVIHPSKSQITIFDFGQSVREHFSVTAFPTIKAFELLHEDELLEPPPPLRAFSKSTAVSLLFRVQKKVVEVQEARPQMQTHVIIQKLL